MKKLFAIVTTLFIVCSSTFAFDGKTFWKEYGGGLKNGDSLVQAGVGFGGILTPNVTYERMFHINNTLPLSFGGMAGVGIGSGLWVNAAATAKWHFNFGIDKLDVYINAMAGVNLWLSNGVHPGFLWGTNAGATWFFTDKIAATIESGYPYWVNAKFTMKF